MKDTLLEWLKAIYHDHGPGWALATFIVLMGTIMLAMYLKVNPLEWLN